MLQINSVLAESRSKLLRMRPMVGIPSRFHFRNKTSCMWKRRFSGKEQLYKQLNPSSDKRVTASSSAASANMINTKHHAQNIARSVVKRQKLVSMKWAVLTGVTLMIGTFILVNSNKKNKRHQNEQLFEQGLEQQNQTKEQKRKYKRIKIFNNNWLFFCYSTLPLNAVSRLWGQFNHLTLPVWFRPYGFKFYSYLFDVNLDEMQDPNLYHYSNLSEFFYRTIKPEVRPIAPGDNVIVSPSDGQLLQMGMINSETGEIEQVKGLTYSIKEFLGTHSHPLMTKSESSLNLLAHEDKHKEFAMKNKFKHNDTGKKKIWKRNSDDNIVRSKGNITNNNNDAINKVSNNDLTIETADVDDDSISQESINIENIGDKSLKQYDSSGSKIIKLLTDLSLNIPFYNYFSNTDPRNTELYFAVIYLSPGDYHHYHSPINWVCKKRRHFPGDLFSVAPYFQRNFPNLFVLNERVALLGYWKYGFFSMTPVGATNVGSIKLNFDEELVTNTKRQRHLAPHTCYEATYSNASKILGGMPLVKGEEMGGFELGSTVVLCFEAPNDFKFNVKVGDKVKLGQKLGTVESDD